MCFVLLWFACLHYLLLGPQLTLHSFEKKAAACLGTALFAFFYTLPDKPFLCRFMAFFDGFIKSESLHDLFHLLKKHIPVWCLSILREGGREVGLKLCWPGTLRMLLFSLELVLGRVGRKSRGGDEKKGRSRHGHDYSCLLC